ncbi:DUF2314 domain-containing protein [Piscinibacter gummiphilus]|uniref:DUF2314 domain-containing protein n=1 Tax=Piscinibacter gummiphilus TaxID=946333 RepID=A0ABZ0CVA7_9BURK|nr:DUF2314 domain-containing protein [Piscinibacter gummiphilus]WOB06882.1 DUF2314 domain-containing protein [Piscinibacter gummiphilus]
MRIDPLVIAGVGSVVVAVWLFARWRSPRPEYPPLETDPNDPLMLDALAKATATTAQFLSLARQYNENAVVKLRFVSNTNQVEHLWAEVLEVLSDKELGVRLVTPPVSHRGQLDRLYRCDIYDVEDWQVTDSQREIHGGFSQRAMFAIARRDGIKLPEKLLEHERLYKDA